MNPCMPLWEHIADGEPHVFKNPETGEERLYIYGTHDTSEVFFGALNYELWSAPVNDLSDWTDHGIIYEVERTDKTASLAALFAPDCCQGSDGRFYLFAFPIGAVSDKRNILVSDSPQGPFTPYGTIEYLGDPAVLVDDDGAVYVYNGGPGDLTSTVSRLGRDMLTTLETKKMLTKEGAPIPNFFEASSIRKVGDVYIYIYSSARKGDAYYFSQTAQGLENGYALLEYCYSNSPMGPWTYGGILMNNGGEVLGSGGDYYYRTRRSYYNGTIHGSIEQVAGQWYVFYHKNTNNSDYSRQTCMEPIDVIIQNGTVIIKEAEMTSQGWESEGLRAGNKYPAGIACYLTNGAYITYGGTGKLNENPIVNITNGTVVGIKYVDFGKQNEYRLSLELKPMGQKGKVAIKLDSPKNTALAIYAVKDENSESYYTLTEAVGKIEGKHAVYFVFYAVGEAEICALNSFYFQRI